jgi:GAF domain-containing protein/HAMP domain-containing protein
MKNLTRQQTTPPASGIATDHIFKMGLIRVLSDIGVLAFFAYLSFQIGAWQLTYLTTGIGAMAVVGFVGLWFIRRQRPQLGIWLIVAELWPAALLVIALIAGVALPLGVIILILTLFTAGQVLPQKQTGWALVIATGFFLVELGIDQWSPAYRLPVPPQFLIGIFAVAGALILIYGYFTVRDFPNYSLRTKLAITFLLVTLASLGTLTFFNIRSTRMALVAVAQTPEIIEAPIQTQIQTNLFFTVLIGMIVAVGAFILGHYLAGPITRLTTTAQQISGGNLQAQATVEAQDEIGQLAEAFNSMTAQLRHLIGSLEDQVQARTAELSLSMEVGQRAAAIQELAELLPTITEFIRQQFDLYHTQVYFIDNLGQNLVLEASTGKVGQELLARHHTLPVGPGSIVGRVAVEGQAIAVPDTTKSDIHKPNPLLPNTRSELAVPLIVEGQVIGVLDMQATQPDTFTEKNRTVFEAMGTQLAIAIHSAQQWALTQEAQEKSEQALRQLTRQSWTETLATHRRNLGFDYDLSAVKPVTSLEKNGGVVVPVTIQNQVIGQLTVQPPEGKVLSADEQSLLSAVSQQLAQKAENIRLFEETQQRATREQIARQIADKIRASRDIEMALKTAATELNKALGTAKAVVNLQIIDPAHSTKIDE